MKQKILIPLCLSILMGACKSKSDKPKTELDPVINTNNNSAGNNNANESGLVHTKILGSYVGSFGDNKISFLITKAVGDSVGGRTVVGGNDRPFNGMLQITNGIYKILVSEPGNDKYDGKFAIQIKEALPNVVEGTFTPYKNTTTAKEFVLQRKAFEYNIDLGAFPQASKRLLKEEDVENLAKEDLEHMRNEIFARHGYCFKKKEIRNRFEVLDWYVPNSIDISGNLTSIEKKNIELIKRYEKYAEDYSDEYGR